MNEQHGRICKLVLLIFLKLMLGSMPYLRLEAQKLLYRHKQKGIIPGHVTPWVFSAKTCSGKGAADTGCCTYNYNCCNQFVGLIKHLCFFWLLFFVCCFLFCCAFMVFVFLFVVFFCFHKKLPKYFSGIFLKQPIKSLFLNF